MTLKEYLRRWEMRQKDFAAIIGVSDARISQIVNGWMPSFALAMKIESATNGRVKVQDLAKEVSRNAATVEVDTRDRGRHESDVA